MVCAEIFCFSDSNKQRILSDEGAQIVAPGSKSLLSKQYQLRMERRYGDSMVLTASLKICKYILIHVDVLGIW